MKHFYYCFLFAIIFLPQLCKAQNYDFSSIAPSGQTLYYNIVNGEAQVTYPSVSSGYGHSTLTGNLIIPDSVFYNGNTYCVTTIKSFTFANCNALTSIVIPNAVRSIGESAFHLCTALNSITLPDSLTSISNSMFDGCFSLDSVLIPNTVTIIGNAAFNQCSTLTNIVIPNSVTSIGSSAFAYCTSLSSVTLPDSITSIQYNTFYECRSLSSITIPNTVVSIGESAFLRCISLTSIIIPHLITTIEAAAFSNCLSLTNVLLPDSITSIGNSAFRDCTSLISISFPESLTLIGNYAFYNCESLTNISLPESLLYIGDYAFYNCSFTNITIPNSVDSIGLNPFAGCSDINQIVVSSGNSVYNSGYDSRNGSNAIIKTANNALISGCKNTTIPYTVVSIENSAFYGCSSLSSISIPNTVNSIGEAAFKNCSSLANINIPNTITSIQASTFANCTSLINLIIPNTVTTINAYAFENSSIENLFIPNSITTVNPKSFKNIQVGILNIALITPFYLTSYNSALRNSNIVNIPCGSTSNYQTIWGAGNYYESVADIMLILSSSIVGVGNVTIVPQDSSLLRCSDTIAVIQATPNYGYHFVQWSNGSYANPDTVHLSGDSSITAVFEKNQYILTLLCNDDSIGAVNGSGTYEYLDEVTITATTTASHHHFVVWSDGVTDASRTITLTENLTLTAIFAIDTHHVNLMVNDANYGYVTGDGDYPYGSTVFVNAIPYSGYYFREWNDGEINTSFSFTLTDDTSFTAIFSPEIIPSLCMVTVQDDHNVLLWEKEQIVSEYHLFRESVVADEYELVATVPYDSLSTLVDTSSRPRTRSYRYRISAVDIYGHEADRSDIHKTMHLTISQGIGDQWNLVWTEYEGANYNTYVIYRGSNPTDMNQIDVMPSGGNTTYTDESAPAGDVYYQVGIMLSSPCNPTQSDFIVRSNVATNSSTGIHETQADNIWIYARNGQITVVGEYELQDVQIYDLSGKLLKTVRVNGNNAVINISDIATGVYLVRVNTENGSTIHKVLK